ncbi:ClpP/crotonase [Aureobasidium pullulans]|uniref:3-hydroxyisobutyryl-CoA hydrolase n=1 Tax=Aureobasidium pullulans TaxID=5580 RepID=A0A4T0B5T8_AURPU|nr:ClpP/crotonase [Aureobasidium pullulans]
MPLRARINNANFSDMPTEQAGDESNDVLFNSRYGVRTIELNRPKKLNSLNGSMARLSVLGHVAALAKNNQSGPEGQQRSKDYFALEYKLDHTIATYSKPYVAFMGGIAMGGGVGLSVHAPFRIATENTVFAMPETTIGFFPDVGASFFLPRMDGALGTYLALTSEQTKGVNAFLSGIASHYLHTSSLRDLEARLAELNFGNDVSYNTRLSIINDTIEEFTTGMPYDAPPHFSTNVRIAIDYYHGSPVRIRARGLSLEVKKWAVKTRETIAQRSPTSVKVALAQLRRGTQLNIAQTFQNEHNIASKFMEHPDFVEGVSARLIRKPAQTPEWSKTTFDQVSETEASAPDGPPYTDHPYAWTALPREAEVEAFVKSNHRYDIPSVVEHFVRVKRGKMGVREKVEEVMTRRTVPDNNKRGFSWT